MAAAAGRAANSYRADPWVHMAPAWGCPACGKIDNFHKHTWCGNAKCRAARPPPPPPLGSLAAWPPIAEGGGGRPKPKKKGKKTKKGTDNPAAAAAVEAEPQTNGNTEKPEITSEVLQGLHNMLQQCRSFLPESDPLTGAFQKRLEEARAKKQAQQPAGQRLRSAESKLASKQRQHDTLETRLAEQKVAVNKTESELAKAVGEVETIQKEVVAIKAQLASETNLPENTKEINQIKDLQAQLPAEIHDQISAPLEAIFKTLNEFKASQAAAKAQAEAVPPPPQPVPMEDDLDFIYAAGAETCKRAGEILAGGDREAFKKFRTEQRQQRRPAPYQQGGAPAAPAAAAEAK